MSGVRFQQGGAFQCAIYQRLLENPGPGSRASSGFLAVGRKASVSEHLPVMGVERLPGQPRDEVGPAGGRSAKCLVPAPPRDRLVVT
jgi:hypothetical protein